jgi:hypothetical protein
VCIYFLGNRQTFDIMFQFGDFNCELNVWKKSDIDNGIKKEFNGICVCWANSINIMLLIIQKNSVKKIELLFYFIFLWVCACMIVEVC